MKDRFSTDNIPIFGVVLTICYFIFFIDKPVHVDEANFLAMLESQFWTPHNILINWEGKQELAFDVLSNPPGLVWYLWAFRELPIWGLRCLMFPIAILSVFGVFYFGQHFGKQGTVLSSLFVVTPFFAISSNSMLPELLIVACVSWGWSFLLSEKHVFFGGFLCGLSAIFRYSGLTMIPLVLGWLVLGGKRKKWQACVGVLLPAFFLFLHDVMSYGQWHFLHMISFQSELHQPINTIHQIASVFSMLFGGFLCWMPGKNEILDWGIGIALLGVLVAIFGVSAVLIWNYIFVLFGILLFLATIRFWYQKKEYWLVLWSVGAVFFLCYLRFMATRYWAPFFLPMLLMTAIQMSDKNIVQRILSLMMFLSFALAWDDYQLAKRQYELAEKVEEEAQKNDCSQQFFASHWGWQYYLEAKNWRAIETGLVMPNNVCFSYSEISWPQITEINCERNQTFIATFSGLPLRVHSYQSRANYHSNYISDDPSLRTFAPWGLSFDAWDVVHFFSACPAQMVLDDESAE